jgi:hypothetical protein
MAFLTIPAAHWHPHQLHPVLVENEPLSRGLVFAEVKKESG